MTNRQELFIQHYLTSFNATQSAIKAGYSEDTARVIGSQNSTKVDIKQAIDEGIAKIVAQTDDKRAKLIKYWVSVIDDTEAKETDRLKASDLLGKYLAMFTENLNIGNQADKSFKVSWE